MFKNETLNKMEMCIDKIMNSPVKDKEKVAKSYLQIFEDEFAKRQNRHPATISFVPAYSDGENIVASYDVIQHNIEICYSKTTSALSLLINIRHESVHADQATSPDKTENQKKLYAISQALYVDPDIENTMKFAYKCNYKELEAKATEAEYLVALYRDEISLVDKGILSISAGKEFMYAFGEMADHLKKLNVSNIMSLMKTNIKRVKQGDFVQEMAQGLTKNEMLSFLCFKAPILYMEMCRRIGAIRQQVERIAEALNKQYNIEISQTANKLSEIQEAKIQKKQEEYNIVVDALKKQKNSKVVEKLLSYDTKEDHAQSISELEQKVSSMQQDDKIAQIAIMGAPEQDFYKILYTTIFPNTSITLDDETENRSNQQEIQVEEHPQCLNDEECEIYHMDSDER